MHSELLFPGPHVIDANSSSLTAIGNDYGFDEVFSRPLSALGAAGDIAFGISTSGNSPNVIRALEVARTRQMTTIGLSGRAGKLPTVVDHALAIPSDCTPASRRPTSSPATSSAR